ncbi:MAG UNVERIFIED_CONTAM: hypothetical protein LVR29_17725 [Microcystis novacekii LVE1205-3]|jgi:hypothetical protein
MHDLMQVSSEDPVGLYFRQMSQEPLLSAEEEIELARRIQNGTSAHARLADTLDPNMLAVLHAQISDAVEARQHLSRANTRLVVSIAKRYIAIRNFYADIRSVTYCYWQKLRPWILMSGSLRALTNMAKWVTIAACRQLHPPNKIRNHESAGISARHRCGTGHAIQ